jgi:hypothetical protein
VNDHVMFNCVVVGQREKVSGRRGKKLVSYKSLEKNII